MRLLATLGAAILAVVACRTTDAVHNETPSMSVDSTGTLSVSPASATLHLGDTLRARAWGVTAIDVRWTSSDTSVAVIDFTGGLIRARAAGRATTIAKLTSNTTVSAAMALDVVP